MPKLSIEDLDRLRGEIKSKSSLGQAGAFRIKITVHMGTCGIAAGARKIMEAFMQEIESRNLDDILLTTTGCAGMCSHEPMATIEFANETPVKYIDLDPEKAHKIFTQHIIEGKPVVGFALALGSERSI